MKEFSELLTLYNPPFFVCTRGRFLHVIAAWGVEGMGQWGWSWRRQDGSPHPCLTPFMLFVCFVLFFLHSLLSIQLLYNSAEASSLPLSINDVPPSLAHQKEPCAFSWSLAWGCQGRDTWKTLALVSGLWSSWKLFFWLCYSAFGS